MKVVFLGTNGWYSSETGHTTCILLDTAESYIILDAGSGIYKITEHILLKLKRRIFSGSFGFNCVFVQTPLNVSSPKFTDVRRIE